MFLINFTFFVCRQIFKSLKVCRNKKKVENRWSRHWRSAASRLQFAVLLLNIHDFLVMLFVVDHYAAFLCCLQHVAYFYDLV